MNVEEIARAILRQTDHVSAYDDMRLDLLDCAVRYASLRVKWALADHEGRAAMDEERTRAHNVFIDSCNILSRAMARNGHDTTWRADAGNNRAAIGDVACHLHCLLALSAR